MTDDERIEWLREYNSLDGDRLQELWQEIDRLRAENARLRAALMRVGDDYPGSSLQQWCYEQVGIAPMIDHAPDPLHVTIEDGSIKRAAAYIAMGVEIDRLREETATLRAERDEHLRWRTALADQLHITEHQVITCGVAATNPDPNLTRTGVYADKWNSNSSRCF